MIDLVQEIDYYIEQNNIVLTDEQRQNAIELLSAWVADFIDEFVEKSVLDAKEE